MVLKPIQEQPNSAQSPQSTGAPRRGKDGLSFAPVQRQHPLGDGRTTDLVNLSINLDDKIRKGLGEVKVGDVKDFTLTVTVLAGFEMQQDS